MPISGEHYYLKYDAALSIASKVVGYVFATAT